jgi:uncharacterized UPF0160 family protein
MKTGRVYKIISTQGNECYVGSTFNTTRDRFKEHKKQYNEWQENKARSKTSSFNLFEKYGFENCRMILIKEYEVCDREHLNVYETLWIKKLQAINEIEPAGGLLKSQRKKQWYNNNKEKCLQKNKENYLANKSKIQQQQKDYHRSNLDTIKKQTRDYYQNHKEKKIKYQRDYAANHREAIRKQRGSKRKCEICECEITYVNYAKHMTTSKHQVSLTRAYFADLPFYDGL